MNARQEEKEEKEDGNRSAEFGADYAPKLPHRQTSLIVSLSDKIRALTRDAVPIKPRRMKSNDQDAVADADAPTNLAHVGNSLGCQGQKKSECPRNTPKKLNSSYVSDTEYSEEDDNEALYRAIAWEK
jgi:hypothetical protein